MAGIAADAAPAPRAFTLRPRVLRTLLWLRWQLLLRGYSRSASRIVGAVVLAIILIPSAIGLTIGLVAGFRALMPDHAFFAQNLLFYILAGVYLLYALLPLLQFSINEGLDVTKLAVYPLSQPELMASLLISTLLDIPTIAVGIVFVGLGLGWANSPAQAVGIAVVLVLAYIHLVAISQLLLSSMMGVLRTRRYRDLALILATVLGLSCSLGSQAFSRLIPAQQSADNFIAVLNYDIGAWLQFLPPGMVGRAIIAINAGNWAVSGAWLAALVASAYLIIWAWSAVLTRALATPEDGAGASRRRRARATAAAIAAPSAPAIAAPTAASAPDRPSLIPAPALALMQKDLRYYWRDVTYKRAFLGSLYVVGIILLNLFALRSGTGDSITQLIVAASLFLVLNLTAYSFSYEGQAVTTLALFPVRGVHVFLGRNIAAFLVGLVELIALLLVEGAVTQNWVQTGILGITGIGALVAAMGPANVIAVLFPIRMQRQGVGRPQNDSGTGCLTSLISSLSYLGSLLLLSPIAAIVLVPQVLGQPNLSLVLSPLAILYGAGIYAAGTAWASSLYYSRLPKIIEVVARE